MRSKKTEEMTAMARDDVRRIVQEARGGLAPNLSGAVLHDANLSGAGLVGVIDASIKAYSKWENKNREKK